SAIHACRAPVLERAAGRGRPGIRAAAGRADSPGRTGWRPRAGPALNSGTRYAIHHANFARHPLAWRVAYCVPESLRVLRQLVAWVGVAGQVEDLVEAKPVCRRRGPRFGPIARF